MVRGVMYVAYGAKARREAAQSIASLRQWHDWPVLAVGDARVKGAAHQTFPDRGTPGRWAKVNLDNLTRWDETLFLDADTRIHGPLDAGFRLLGAGYDLVMVPSRLQHHDALRHLGDDERAATLRELYVDPLELNTGVMWFGRGAGPLFEMWREEWERWRARDQGAFLRALHRRPVAVALLGWPYNHAKGEVVEHRFGACGA